LFCCLDLWYYFIMIQNPQQKHGGFEQPQITEKQAEVEKLRQEIAEMRKQLAEKKIEMKQEVPVEMVREGKSGSDEMEGMTASVPPVVAQPMPPTAVPTDIDNQVKSLCDLAFQKGVEVAIKAAQELNNPYVLDEFHDVLVDELYEKLLGEKKIEKE